MSTVNKAILLGRLGGDPELRYTATNISVANFTMATSKKWHDKQTDEWKEKTSWHRVVVWNKQAENVAKYLKKGSQVYIEGELQTRSYGEEDNKRYITEVVAKIVVFCGGGKSQEVQQRADEVTQGVQNTFDGTQEVNDEDIPF